MELPILIAAIIAVGLWLVWYLRKRRTARQLTLELQTEVKEFEPRSIQLRHSSGSVSTASVLTSVELPAERCVIVLSVDDTTVTAEGSDFFRAFKEMRSELATMGFIPQCYGANRNAMTSGMSMDMSGGLSVYVAATGDPLSRVKVVGIFDSGPDLDPVTVEEQEAFGGQYTDSLERDDTIMKQFMRRVEGVDVMSLPELDPTEWVKVVTIGGVVKLPAQAFSRDYERLVEHGKYCIAKVLDGGVTWLVLWTVNGGPGLKRLRTE